MRLKAITFELLLVNLKTIVSLLFVVFGILFLDGCNLVLVRSDNFSLPNAAESIFVDKPQNETFQPAVDFFVVQSLKDKLSLYDKSTAKKDQADMLLNLIIKFANHSSSTLVSAPNDSYAQIFYIKALVTITDLRPNSNYNVSFEIEATHEYFTAYQEPYITEVHNGFKLSASKLAQKIINQINSYY